MDNNRGLFGAVLVGCLFTYFFTKHGVMEDIVFYILLFLLAAFLWNVISKLIKKFIK